ncbi:MAG: glycoside hydrolase family 127 protein [Chloroflexi bacterium]|uniref:beta-L-arabinofuranosidase domain-containing protein n=1 Tax=Candidatus Flexifilum breve TaxID=3140694 RepID=UPI0031358BD8|nr:glycoside hydrolase family 127 protein [Chloroflexota bacterium]
MDGREIDGGFWGDRQRINRDHTMPAVYHQCKITGRIDAWNPQRDPNLPEPHIFWDSDVAKWIEAVGYSVALHPNAEFERQVDEVVDWMEQMQLPDGYASSPSSPSSRRTAGATCVTSMSSTA